MLIAAIVIWLIFCLLGLGLCRAAASADGKERERRTRYPSRITIAPPPSTPTRAQAITRYRWHTREGARAAYDPW
ncbi:MAG TPA: hypothetical protein VGL54_00295 [Solirubrobacteraceae bacterium]|jgi:hypothetical protein